MIKNVPIGTYAIIGTLCVEFENVMKSTHKKKWLKMFIELVPGQIGC